jgi:hypothetical protein
MKMQDLRERLLRPQTQSGSEIKYAISQIWPATESGTKSREDGFPAARTPEPNLRVAPRAEPENDTTPSKSEALAAVSALFQFADGFDDQIRELVKALEPVEALSRSATKELAPLASFRSQIAQLAGTLEPMKAFYDQLLRLAHDFPPMKSLYDQVARIPEEFRAQLVRLAESLTPAKSFRHRIEELAKAFEPVDALEAQFLELAEAFGQVAAKEHSSTNNNGHAGEIVLSRGLDSQPEAEMTDVPPARTGSDKSAWVLG